MSDRSIELLDKLLVLFKKDNQIYKDLVGDTARAARGVVLGKVDLASNAIDLSTVNKLKIAVDGAAAVSVTIIGATPASTTMVEIVTAINTALGATVASIASSKALRYLKLASTTTGTGSSIQLLPAASADAITALLGYEVGTYIFPDPTNRRVNDHDLGAIANVLEYTRQYALMCQAFLVIGSASGYWLDYILGDVYGVRRPAGMSDADYRLYGVAKVFSIKATPPAIRYILDRTFPEPSGDATKFADYVQIVEGMDDGMFSDVSFTDYYRDRVPYEAPNTTYPYYVKAALAGAEGGMPFFFRVILEGNVSTTKAATILQLVEAYHAAGTTYVIEVR